MMAAMASTIPGPNLSVSSQPGGTPTTSFSHIPPKASTPNVTATNGFRPSIPPKSSRVPAVEIDKMSSSSKMGNQASGRSTPTGTPVSATNAQSLPPPLFPYPPTKGISNAQARTARKSAPSSSNRGDGYSTSSSGGGRKSSITSTGKSHKEKRDRESLSYSESPIPVTGHGEGSNHKRSPQPQTPLPAPPKPQLLPSTQKPQQQESQTSPRDNPKQQQQKEAVMAAIPAPPSFAGPSTQAAGAKRPASPTPPDVFTTMMSGKPKRQKIATAKAAALANDGMNADGSLVRSRKPRKNVAEKGAKEREKEKPAKAKGKEKIAGVGRFALGDRCIPGEAGNNATNSVAAKPSSTNAQPPRLPNPPPPYQVPIHLQKQNTQGQQERKDYPIPQTVPGSLFASGTGLGTQDARMVTSSEPAPGPQANGSFSMLHMQTPVPQRRVPDDVISISSSPIDPSSHHNTIPQSPSERAHREPSPLNHDKMGLGPGFKDQEQGRHQSRPITIDDPCSEGEDSTASAKPPDGNAKIIMGSKAGKPDNAEHSNNSSTEPSRVSDEFFAKCIDTSVSNDERTHMFMKIQSYIGQLVVEAKKYPRAPKEPRVLDTRRYLENEQNTTTLEGKIAALLKHMGVLTDGGTIITLDGWKNSGRTKFEGRLILPDYSDVWRETQSKNKPDEQTGPNTESQPPNQSGEGAGGVVADVDGGRAVSPANTPTKPQTSLAVSSCTVPSCKAQQKANEPSANGKPKENDALINGSLQPLDTASSYFKQKLPLLSENPTFSAQVAIPQPQDGLNPSNSSDQAREKAATSTANSVITSSVSGTLVPASISGKRKRKTLAAPTVEDFIESEASQEMQFKRTSNFSRKQQERNITLSARIIELDAQELRVREEIDAVAAEAKIKEIEFEQRIVKARSGIEAGATQGEGFGSTSELGKGPARSLVNWSEYRQATKELRDFQDDIRRKELRLADRAVSIAEEKQFLLECRKSWRQIKCEEAASSSRTSEERSVGSTAPTSAPSSVSGSLDENQSVPPPGEMPVRVPYPEMSMGHELLRALVPWATQLQDITTESTSPVPPESGSVQTKSKKRPNRRRKNW